MLGIYEIAVAICDHKCVGGGLSVAKEIGYMKLRSQFATAIVLVEAVSSKRYWIYEICGRNLRPQMGLVSPGNSQIMRGSVGDL